MASTKPLPSKTIIFKGRVFTLLQKRCQLPNGVITNIEIVNHPGAVLIIPFLNENTVILLKQFRPVIGSYLYELPAGTREKNESWQGCAQRELMEETGYTAAVIKKNGFIYPVPGYSTEKIIIFTATGLKKQSKIGDADEIITNVTVTRTQVQRLFRRGSLVDAKTISAFVYCGWL